MTLLIVPIIALSVEQTILTLRSKNILAFHLEKICAVEKIKLISFLDGLNKGKHRFMLFALPHSLDPGKGWGALVQTLILKGLFLMVAIDEMHCVPKYGTRSFRITFAELLENIFIYLHQSPCPIALLSMTRTLTSELMTQF